MHYNCITMTHPSPAAGYRLPPSLAHAVTSVSLKDKIRVSIVRTTTGYAPLIWSSFDCVRLRGEGGVAISPVGMCPLKLSTNGKAAAVPAALSDEELFLCHTLGWLDCVDSATGASIDAQQLLDTAVNKAGGEQQKALLLLKRTAFMDLWARGYRLTSGLKFGVEYLAYRSDPSVCHAAFMVRVLPAGRHITPLDLVVRARIATTTLKTAVLAYVDLDSGNVHYEAFKRMGSGHAVFEAASALAVPLRMPAQVDSEAASLPAASNTASDDLSKSPTKRRKLDDANSAMAPTAEGERFESGGELPAGLTGIATGTSSSGEPLEEATSRA